MKIGNSKLVYWIWITLTKKLLLPFPLMTFLFDVCNTMIQDQRTAQTHPKNQPFFMSPNRKMLLTEKVHNIILDISLYHGKLATFPIRIHQENYPTICFYHQEKFTFVSKKTSTKKQINWNSSCIFKEFRSEFCQKNQMVSPNLWQFRPVVKSVDKIGSQK